MHSIQYTCPLEYLTKDRPCVTENHGFTALVLDDELMTMTSIYIFNGALIVWSTSGTLL